ncbi:MAG: O-antigen ligase family protein, partial [Patescibacteria group bacterium]
LTQTSRIASTFAGHYDLAAYLVFAIVLFASLILGLRNVFVRVLLIFASLASGIVLLWTQSRNSLLALGAALFCVIWWHKKKALLIPIVVAGIIALPIVFRSSDRYAKTFQYRRVLFDSRAGLPAGAAQMGSDGRVTIEESASPGVDSLPIGSGFIRIPLSPPIPVIASYAVTALRESEDYPVEGIPMVGEEAQMAFERNELRFSTLGPVATTSGEVQTLSNRFFLDRALTYDISITTRFQGTWPRAWEAFSRNVLTGSGYSVLNLASDNDYLRALGETGILGLFTFFFIFFAYFVFVRRAVRDATPLVASVAFGVGGGIVSLLVAAFFVDIFEASKMAYILWMMMGVAVGGLLLKYKKSFPVTPLIVRILTHPFAFIGLLAVGCFILFGDSQSIYFVGDDFTWLRWAASTYLADIPRFFTDATGFFYRPLSKMYFVAAYAFFWFKPGGYHLVNVVLHATSTVLVYLLARQTTKRTVVAIASSLLFLVMAIHHENVYWISGISSLAGATSAFLSVYLFLRFLGSDSVWRYLALVTSFFFMAAALLWYEGMLG